MSKKNKLPKKLKKELRNFLEYHSPAEFSAKLRRVVLDYTQYELRAGIIPLYLDNFLWSLNDFFDLPDIAAKEFTKPSHSPYLPSPPVEKGRG
jgi:hypothetical protein